MADREIDFDDLVGQEFDFYGVEGQCFKLDDVIYEAIEDGLDGSTELDHVEISDAQMIYVHALPIARVVIEQCAFSEDVYELTDLHDGHCWLRFGTEVAEYNKRLCVYETEFVFEYTPKAPGD